jgi:hypothetical protein
VCSTDAFSLPSVIDIIKTFSGLSLSSFCERISPVSFISFANASFSGVVPLGT